MSELVKTMKLHLRINSEDKLAIDSLFKELTKKYTDACNEISQYIFDNGFVLNYTKIQKVLYQVIRDKFGLKSQMTISCLKTVTAKYKTVESQLLEKPFRYQDENGVWQFTTRTLDWLWKPVCFKRPQADLVYNRDYSFVNGMTKLSINMLGHRVKVSFDQPKCFEEYFDSTWEFGTAKLVYLKGQWYLHISATKEVPDSDALTTPKQVVGIDRGLRNILTTYDGKGKCGFFKGEEILNKRANFLERRAELQSRGTKSAKRKLKELSGRENRWMADINHQLSKALIDRYEPNTLFVLEDLTGVSFDEGNLSNRSKKGRNELRSWSFYQFEQFLSYKAMESGSSVLKVAADYTSQRCPKCGRIHKGNRHHDIHEYICDCCGYRSNDDRVGAMNIYTLGTLYVSGDMHPRFGTRKRN